MNIQNGYDKVYPWAQTITLSRCQVEYKLLKPDLEIDTNFLQCQITLALRIFNDWIITHCIIFLYYKQIITSRDKVYLLLI